MFIQIYLHDGDVKQIRLFDNALGIVSKNHESIEIGMDANAMNALWDDSHIPPRSRSKRMGHLLTDVLAKHNLVVHNPGACTYHTGDSASAIDIAVTRGDLGSISWKVFDDDLSSPHSGIKFSIGMKPVFDPVKCIDWDKFDWKKYALVTELELSNLLLK